MAEETISRDMALRVALAAKSLEGVDLRDLLSILEEAVGLPLTPVKLEKLNLKAFRKAGGETLISVAPEQIKTAIKHLKGKTDEAAGDLPETETYEEGEMPGSLRVAIASNTGELLDGHFGSCGRFLVYQVSADALRLIDVRSVEEVDDEEDKNVYRASLIKDCQLLYIVSVGGPAVPKIIRADIHPVKKPDGGNAREVLAGLQEVLGGATIPPWLAKVLGQSPEERIRFEREEVES